MLIVKAYRGTSMVIREADKVEIHNCGPAEGQPNSIGGVGKPSGKVRVVEGTRDGSSFALYVANPYEPIPADHYGLAQEVEFFDGIYIENSNGATTEVVRAA